MFDSILRKIAKPSSSRSNLSTSSTQPDLNQLVIGHLRVIQQPYTHSQHIELTSFGCSCQRKSSIESNEQHIYEEIADDDKLNPCRCVDCVRKLTNLQQEQIIVNERKKSVRFTNSSPFSSQAGRQQIVVIDQNNKNSILKKKSSRGVSSFISIYPDESIKTGGGSGSSVNESSSSSLSSSCSNTGIYTTNSLNSQTSSLSSGSHHSLVFNQLVEEFVSKVASGNTTKTNTNLLMSKTDVQENSEKNALTDQRLSFRVSNLSIEDLKRRQKTLVLMRQRAVDSIVARQQASINV